MAQEAAEITVAANLPNLKEQTVDTLNLVSRFISLQRWRLVFAVAAGVSIVSSPVYIEQVRGFLPHQLTPVEKARLDLDNYEDELASTGAYTGSVFLRFQNPSDPRKSEDLRLSQNLELALAKEAQQKGSSPFENLGAVIGAALGILARYPSLRRFLNIWDDENSAPGRI